MVRPKADAPSTHTVRRRWGGRTAPTSRGPWAGRRFEPSASTSTKVCRRLPAGEVRCSELALRREAACAGRAVRGQCRRQPRRRGREGYWGGLMIWVGGGQQHRAVSAAAPPPAHTAGRSCRRCPSPPVSPFFYFQQFPQLRHDAASSVFPILPSFARRAQTKLAAKVPLLPPSSLQNLTKMVGSAIPKSLSVW